jgi:hypothetical protein
MEPTAAFAISHAKSSVSTRTVVEHVLSHALHVLMRSVLLAALTASAACHVELPVTGSPALSAVRTSSTAVINVQAFAVHLVQMFVSVKNALMKTPSLA